MSCVIVEYNVPLEVNHVITMIFNTFSSINLHSHQIIRKVCFSISFRRGNHRFRHKYGLKWVLCIAINRIFT